MNIFARSASHLYINKNGFVVSIQLNHSKEMIADTFYSLPLVKNEDAAIEKLNKQLNK
jgi:hypothetical protein